MKTGSKQLLGSNKMPKIKLIRIDKIKLIQIDKIEPISAKSNSGHSQHSYIFYTTKGYKMFQNILGDLNFSLLSRLVNQGNLTEGEGSIQLTSLY